MLSLFADPASRETSSLQLTFILSLSVSGGAWGGAGENLRQRWRCSPAHRSIDGTWSLFPCKLHISSRHCGHSAEVTGMRMSLLRKEQVPSYLGAAASGRRTGRRTCLLHHRQPPHLLPDSGSLGTEHLLLEKTFMVIFLVSTWEFAGQVQLTFFSSELRGICIFLVNTTQPLTDFQRFSFQNRVNSSPPSQNPWR